MTLTTIPVRRSNNYTLFEGTIEIQRLIVARTISGVCIREGTVRGRVAPLWC